MATEYSLEIDVEASPVKVRELLSQRRGFAVVENGWLHGMGLLVSGCQLWESAQKMYEEPFNIRPQISLSFRLDYSIDEPEHSVEEAVRSSIALMTELKADAVFLFNDERTIMVHRGGQLMLNSNASWFWDMPGRLAWVTVPYTMESFPDL